jgi:hypothetical protein
VRCCASFSITRILRRSLRFFERLPNSLSARAPISVVLGDMLTAAGIEHLTLDWLLGRMGGRSFGLVLLLLSIFGLLPGVSALAAVLLMIPAIQMLLARSTPAFPRRLRSRRF